MIRSAAALNELVDTNVDPSEVKREVMIDLQNVETIEECTLEVIRVVRDTWPHVVRQHPNLLLVPRDPDDPAPEISQCDFEVDGDLRPTYERVGRSFRTSSPAS